MLTLELARRLSDAGLRWKPVSGDRFVVPVSGMEHDVFVISEITVDVHHFATGDVIGFNGTTEWALDSVEQEKVVWLPREDQLRDLLGEAFVSLESLEGGYAVSCRGLDGAVERHADIDAERAYARALLARLEASGSQSAPGEVGD
ncbi:pilus assembly protein CpaE [Terrabacter carboxydivorans]|uniref:Pilus assembly protein CpaE n=1 Tax=Terrabacter carboxydivorans TaxID=619730 RepID=A0ABP5YR67_9MICO